MRQSKLAAQRVGIGSLVFVAGWACVACAVWVTLRAISAVGVPCSSMDAAIDVAIALTSSMVALMPWIAPTASLVAPWICAIRVPISLVASAVWLASVFTSDATTANPLPASPARAASMVALSASRLVCSAMPVMTLTTSPISTLALPSSTMRWLASCASVSAWVATWCASLALAATAWMLAPISALLFDTPCTRSVMRDDSSVTPSAAAAVSPDWRTISRLTAVSCSDAVASV